MFTYFAVHIIMVAKMTHLSHGAAMLINMLLNKDCILTKKILYVERKHYIDVVGRVSE